MRTLALLVLVLALPACHSPSTSVQADTPSLQVVDGRVELSATVHVAAFERTLLGLGMPGYHLAVWGQGKAAGAALFRTQASDREVLAALEGLGLVPGNGLGMGTWEERNNPTSTAPDQPISGPAVDFLVRVAGKPEPLRLDEVLTDPGGRGIEMRFGGHEANIPKWGSGCLACLYSCPGSKVGNSRYTVRDYEKGTTAFRVRAGSLPPDGSAVTLILVPRTFAPRPAP